MNFIAFLVSLILAAPITIILIGLFFVLFFKGMFKGKIKDNIDDWWEITKYTYDILFFWWNND